MSGGEPLGLGDATSAVADLADLADLESALGQEYAGANLEDVDEEAVRRALGRQAVDDLQALRQARARAAAAGLPDQRRAASSSSPRRRSAGWATPRCARCSPGWRTACAAGTTTGTTPGRPAT